MIALALLLFQTAATQAPADSENMAEPQADIEIIATVRADSVEIDRDGTARVELRTGQGGETESTTERTAPPGSANYRNLTIRHHSRIQIADPLARILEQDASERDISRMPDEQIPNEPTPDDQTGDQPS